MPGCTRRVRPRHTPALLIQEPLVKLVRAVVAAAIAVAAAVAFQMAASNASAEDSPDCIHCWGSQDH